MVSFLQVEISEWLEVKEIRVQRGREEARGAPRACVMKVLNKKAFVLYLEDNKEPSRILCREMKQSDVTGDSNISSLPF